jgi:hypothetical protein
LAIGSNGKKSLSRSSPLLDRYSVAPSYSRGTIPHILPIDI